MERRPSGTPHKLSRTNGYKIRSPDSSATDTGPDHVGDVRQHDCINLFEQAGRNGFQEAVCVSDGHMGNLYRVAHTFNSDPPPGNIKCSGGQPQQKGCSEPQVDFDPNLPRTGVSRLGHTRFRCFCHEAQLEVQIVLHKRETGSSIHRGRPLHSLGGTILVPFPTASSDTPDSSEAAVRTPESHSDHTMVAKTTLVCNIAGSSAGLSSIPYGTRSSLSRRGVTSAPRHSPAEAHSMVDDAAD